MTTPKPPPPPSPNRSYLLLFVKILLVLIIIFLLPHLVRGKSHNKRKRRLERQFSSIKRDCEEDMGKCGTLIPEEAMGCITECISPTCHEEIYGANPLEDGEVDFARARLFETCAKKQIRKELKRERSSASASVARNK